MTVQERPAAAAKPTTTPAVRLPEQRAANHDIAPAPKPPVVRQPGAWGSEEDRKMVRWLGVMLITLSLYCTTFLWIGARVWS